MDRSEMDRFSMTPQSAFATTTVATAERVTAFLRKVYGWMCVGLAITAGVSFAVMSSSGIQKAILGNPLLFFGLIIAELVMVFALAARATRLAPATAGGLFLAYSVLNG